MYSIIPERLTSPAFSEALLGGELDELAKAEEERRKVQERLVCSIIIDLCPSDAHVFIECFSSLYLSFSRCDPYPDAHCSTHLT